MRRMGRSFWDRHYRLIVWVMFFSIICLLLHALELRAAPVLLSAAQAQSRNKMEQMISRQVQESVRELGGEFVQVERGNDGRVLSVGLDAAKANLLKTELSQQIAQQFDRLSQEELSIPLGSLFGGMLINGRGPELSFRLEPYGVAQVDFEQSFSQAGINQTLYRAEIRVQAQMMLYAGKRQIVPAVDTTFLLEERLIAGEVPPVYPWANQSSAE